jgi:WD40 repeat protein
MKRSMIYFFLCWALTVMCLTQAPVHPEAKVWAQEMGVSVVAFDYNALVDRYATAHSDLTVRIWDAATDQLLHTVQVPDWRNNPAFEHYFFSRLVFSPQGDRLAVSFWGHVGGFVIIDTASGQIVLESSEDIPPVGPIAWSPDGEFLVGIYYTSMTTAPDGFLTLRDSHTGQEINNHFISTSPVALDWHPFDTRLAFASLTHIVIWDVEQWQEVYTIPADENEVVLVAWSPLGNVFVSFGTEGIVRLWDSETGQLQRAINAGYQEGYQGIFWSQNGKWVGVTQANKLQLWNAQTGEAIFSYEAEKQILGAGVLADGSILFASGNTVERLETSLTARPVRPSRP